MQAAFAWPLRSRTGASSQREFRRLRGSYSLQVRCRKSADHHNGFGFVTRTSLCVVLMLVT